MLDYLLHQPDALALVLLLLLVGAAVAVGLVAARRRDRDAVRPPEAEPMVTTWPHLLRRELIASLAALLAVTWWAILLEVPLGPTADPAVTPLAAKAPWFFVGVQEMLQYFDAWLAGAVLPLIMIVGLCALPYLDLNPEGNGRYTLRSRPVALAVVAGLLVMWLLPMVVGLLFRGEHWLLQPVWQPPALDAPLPPPQPLSLADRIGLGGATAQLLGGTACVGPYLAVALLWPRLRRVRGVARMGWVRYMVAGGLLATVLGVAVKVVLVATLDIRYLWVNPWFRI